MALYYFGCSSGIGKKSGKPWFAVNIMRFVPSFGNWTISPVFCSEKFHDEVKSEQQRGKFVIGCAVNCSVGIDGTLSAITPNDDIDPLDLEE